MRKSNEISALVWAAVEKYLTNGCALIISIVLARLIEPNEYGIIATASIFTVILSLFVEPGMSSALIQKKSADKLDYSTLLSFNLIASIGLYLILFFCSNVIEKWFELPMLASVLKVLGVQIIIGAVNSVQIAYVHKNMLFKRYFICSFSSVIIGAGVAVVMAYRGSGVWALVAYNLVKQFVNVLMTFILFECRFGLKFSKERLFQMFPFASKMLFTKFIDQGYVEVTQTIISKKYSSTDLAFYNKGKSFPDLLINNLNSALANVAFPAFSKIQDETDKLKYSLRTAVKMTSFICFPILLGLLACSENFVKVALGKKWLESVHYMQLLCLYYIWLPFSNLIWQSIKAIGKSNVILILQTIKFSLNIVFLITFLIIFDSPIGIALSIVLAYTVSFFAECYMAKRHLNYSLREITVDFAPSLVLSLVMGLIVSFIGALPVIPLLALIIQVLLGIAIYFLGALIFRFPQIKLIKNIIKNKKNSTV